MHLLDVQNRINRLMSIFVTEVKSNTAMSRTDINHVSESVLVPLFKVIYNYKNLRNLNATEINYPGIDLADDTAKVGIQVTSTPGIDKVKKTLTKFKERKLYGKYERLIIYMLIERQDTYSDKVCQDIIQNTFNFSQKNDICDYRTLLRDISHLEIEPATKVLEILEKNVGDTPTPLPANIFSSSNYKVKTTNLPKTETVTLNLLQMQFPDTLYVADLAEDITFDKPPEIRGKRRGTRYFKPRRVSPRKQFKVHWLGLA